MPVSKTVRVRVLRGFVGYDENKTAHLPGAVIDLDETDAVGELHIKRVEEVDPKTPLCEGPEKETTGETAEQIAERKKAEKEAADADIDARIAKAVSEALAKAKK